MSNYRHCLQKLPDKYIQTTVENLSSNLVVITLILLGSMALILSLATMVILGNEYAKIHLAIALLASCIFYVIAFYSVPWLIDLSQQWLYRTRWISLSEFAVLSPEIAKAIQLLCDSKSLKQPRIGIIDNHNHTAFIYSSFSGGTRLILSQSLVDYNPQPVEKPTNFDAIQLSQ